MSLPHQKKLIEYSRQLRKNSTLAEVLLWERLRGRKLLGFKFRRQAPIKNYIVDFFCHELMLVIEIDGSTHLQKEDYDATRDEEIENLGIRILHFGDNQVKRSWAAW